MEQMILSKKTETNHGQGEQIWDPGGGGEGGGEGGGGPLGVCGRETVVLRRRGGGRGGGGERGGSGMDGHFGVF